MSDLKVTADPGTQEIVITRSFDAPRDLVFKAFTDPDAVGQWWGLDSTETVVDQLEARPGGRWRFVERERDGSEYGFHGVYHDVQAPERLVYTFEFEGMPGHVLLETIVLEDQGGRTLVTWVRPSCSSKLTVSSRTWPGMPSNSKVLTIRSGAVASW